MTPNRSHKNEAAARVDGRPKMATRRQEAGAGARAPPRLNTDISHEWEGESRPGHNMGVEDVVQYSENYKQNLHHQVMNEYLV